jgi:hypothetical protein
MTTMIYFITIKRTISTNMCCFIISITSRVKTHYTIHKMLSQGNFCKILGFIISYVIKYNQLKWKRTQHWSVIYNIITLYEFHR